MISSVLYNVDDQERVFYARWNGFQEIYERNVVNILGQKIKDRGPHPTTDRGQTIQMWNGMLKKKLSGDRTRKSLNQCFPWKRFYRKKITNSSDA